MIRALHVALTFLTTLPLPPVRAWREDDTRRSVRAYPLVGILLGTLLGSAWWALSAFPDPLRGALLLGVWLLLTGALHLDGFCDMADAAFSSQPPEARQKIAKDPHFGAFALAAGGTLLLVKAAALGHTQPVFLLVIPTLSRTFVVLPMALGQVHDSSLLGRSARLSLEEVPFPLVLGAVLCAGATVLIGDAKALFWLALASFGTTLLLAWWLGGRLGGLGGDAYGALIESSEAVMLTLAVIL